MRNEEVMRTELGGGTAAPEVSIIIVNWKSSDYVKKCLQSIYRFTQGLEFEVIVVDSASYDGCGEMLAREFPGARFIQSKENLGFSRANNLGFQASSAGTLLFINPDTELSNAAINILFDHLRRTTGAGAVGAKLLNADGTVQTSCIQASPTILNQAFDSDVFRRMFPKAGFWGTSALLSDADCTEVEMLSGACIMMKRSVFEQINMFSTNYFMYCEDAHLCYDIIRAGHKIYYVPSAKIVHYGGGSSQHSRSQFSNVMMRESIWRFFLRTKGNLYGLGYRGAMMFSAMFRLALVGLTFPFRLLRGESERAGNSARKWMAILGWSLGTQTWVKKND